MYQVAVPKLLKSSIRGRQVQSSIPASTIIPEVYPQSHEINDGIVPSKLDPHQLCSQALTSTPIPAWLIFLLKAINNIHILLNM